MAAKRYLTPEGLEKFKKELDYLKNTKRKEISEKIKYAVSQGDLSENAGYDSAKEEQAFVEGRIRELKAIISQAEVINKGKGERVQIGSFVSLKSKEGKEVFQIVDPKEADVLNKKISFQSPLGKALLNKKKGDIIKFDTPDGRKEYKIEKIN